MTIARGSFTLTGGDEKTIRDAEGEFRLTRVSGTQTFEGGIVGQGSVEWLMAYSPDRSARYVGFQRVEGTIGDRSGSFMLESTGFHDGRSSVGSWRVVPGSGTGDLAGITGHGSFEAPGGPVVAYELEYELA
jgi:Protein of unknown function (DUF3224)